MKRLKSVDRLSELPDSLIFKILSFLEMRDIVKTSLISKRWKDLWTITPYLNFKESNKNAVQTLNFINRVLLRWKGTKILKFRIRFGKVYDASLSGDVDFWVSFAMEKKVEELCIHLPYSYHRPSNRDPVYFPPQCLYSCSSLTKLCLVGCNLQIYENGINVQWDKLKILRIHGCRMSEDVINQVVSSTPKLEILDVCFAGMRQNLNIRSSSLKRVLLVNYLASAKYELSNYTTLTIWAPNLEGLLICGFAYNRCLLMDVSSLSVADLGFFHTCDVALGETLKQILPAIQFVEVLSLSPHCFKMLGVMKVKYSFSVEFTNVKILKLLGGPIEPYDIVGFVEMFPKMEKLLIDWRLHPWFNEFLENLSQKHDIGENYLELEAKKVMPFLMQLRTVEVTWYSYDVASIFRFIKFLLKHATMVQKIEITKRGNGVVESEGLVVAAQELQSLHRSFPSVDLIFCTK